MSSANQILIEKQGQVGIVNFQTEKLNVLSHALRSDLYEAIQQLLADAEVESIVLAGSAKAFSAGADIAEFSAGTHLQFPSLHDLVHVLSDANKTTIAAISGTALGGGLELALACHHRVIHANAQLALPEVHLGLLPGAAGTQLLPRYIGVDLALEAISTGKPLKLASLKDTALVDVLTETDSKQAAIDFAQNVQKIAHIKHSNIDASAELLAALQAKRTAMGNQAQHVVQHAILNAVEAATTLDFAQGFAQEQALFQSLTESDVSKSLRHAFFAEREAKNIPDLNPDARAKSVAKVAVIGAGTMGSGIAICFLQAGFPVTLIENQQAGLDRGLGLIQKHFSGQVAKGRLSEEKAQAIQANLSTSLEYSALAEVDLALEAVFEDWDVKTAVLKQMDAHLPAHAVLASNTSTLDLNLLAAETSRPEAVVGLHFFSPAQVMPLLEVVRTAYTDDSTLMTALDIGKRLRKVAVVAGVCDGFIGNRMLNEYLRIAGLLIDAGASPYQIDQALENWGMAMGPFRMCDMAGNDIGYLIRKQQLKVDPNKKFSGIADQLVEAKRLGQKTQKGWYDYTQGNRRGDQDAEVLALIDAYRAEQGIQVQDFSDEDIVARCIYALANEGFRLLEEGIALRQSDIDVVYLAGYGFPRWRGGPMFYATQQGLGNMMKAMQQFAQDPTTDASFWQAPALLSQAAA
ncbi:3-hydroxyacyl-CoA dehydrogenase NAD-binding domain-containing protein [Acinetobacter schindleri]|uniref:3-hydroxyacyl-CoA dehydrogenase NAD-binding domain-containing protein n=1 Tax=Acinetobacter schindleri TaxID=108981 RepID=UPI00209AE200|nr:3-hydroxyacyl-CoA dehydrogenase NAD-binding domain-containing protein [Acinetobacter schindleri]MCO8066771.1 3-hydroxyacyl-CoA dehydrogenase NAD-binding domain-containing protein [Acinetobacter schindleri]